ncbi:hypothetical protein Z945_1195 [Sulfitobacter noctilucae]|nr:hypothetical protein Z945_1195 [Sulfitobacter noctilucae]
MMCSANEVVTLAAKAARGGGAPPAQATAFGKAALSHLGAGCAAEDIAAALDGLPDGPVLALPLRLATVLEKNSGEIVDHMISPGPFAALELSYCYAKRFAVTGKTQGTDIHVRMYINQPTKPPPMPRVAVPDELITKMQQLAAKTLVPESDASRISGAGAGLTDND